MARKRPQPQAPKDVRFAAWLRPVCLGWATALAVAAPLVPSERTELTGAALPQAMLWLLAALVWFAGVWLTRQPIRRFQTVDYIAIALGIWIALSAAAMLRYGAPRPMINATWTWVSMLVAFLLLRQLLRSEIEVRALTAVMIGVAVCLSAIAIHQTFIAYPAMRAEYARDPDAVLRQAGITAPPGTVQRKQFEDRLHSTEPNATFSLTNSLAGFIAPWFVVLVAVALGQQFVSGEGTTHSRMRGLAAFTPWLIAIPLGICLLLTKSRSAWLATLVGLAAIAAIKTKNAAGQRPAAGRRLIVITAIATVALASAALAAIDIFDIDIVRQAGRSLAFRLEYWHATLAMIADYPLWGIGPGNFQEFYTAYKLPQASETISDPHNFLLEVAGSVGIPALVLLVLLLVVGVAAVRFASSQKTAAVGDTQEDSLRVTRAVFAGGAVSVPLALVVGLVTDYLPDVAPLLCGAALGALATWLLLGWVTRGTLPRAVIVVAIGVLSINLLAAGGIAFPGVAISLWVLLAMLGAGQGSIAVDRPHAAIAALAATALIAACYATAYQPVLTRLRLSSAIDNALAEAQPDAALRLAEEAAAADPWSANPYLQLAQLHFERWRASDDHAIDDDDLRAFEKYAAEVQARNPRAFSYYVALGYYYFQAYELTGDPRLLSLAMRLVNRSVELYPNDALNRAQLAWLFAQAKLTRDAEREAAEALRLDALCPHRERKLAERRLFSEAGIALPSGAATHELHQLSAEQWMHRLRKTQNAASAVDDTPANE